MATHTRLYIVPTDSWYIERTVWLIAGVVLLAASALAAWVHPAWIGLVMITAAVSITVGLTGFCPVGNVLARLGFRPRLARPGWKPGDLYRMQTDRWYLERRIYVAVGTNLTLASLLYLLHSPWWLAFSAFVGGAMVWFAGTGFCIMANGLYWLGAEPRLAPMPVAPVAHGAFDLPRRT
jgi:general stress protein CsbA